MIFVVFKVHVKVSIWNAFYESLLDMRPQLYVCGEFEAMCTKKITIEGLK